MCLPCQVPSCALSYSRAVCQTSRSHHYRSHHPSPLLSDSVTMADSLEKSEHRGHLYGSQHQTFSSGCDRMAQNLAHHFHLHLLRQSLDLPNHPRRRRALTALDRQAQHRCLHCLRRRSKMTLFSQLEMASTLFSPLATAHSYLP